MLWSYTISGANMDFIDSLRAFAARIQSIKDLLKTEEATKTSLVMPMIQLLGYNVFDPTEVTPELVADVGTKKGEKVDYAILQGGNPIILFECKKAGADLHLNHASQLFRYFHVTAARFGVLTNGLVYKFYTDLEQANKMDETPFFEFNLMAFEDRDVEELKKFSKVSFNLDVILTTANELKYMRAIHGRMSEWLINPPEEFVRLLAVDLIGGRRFTPALKDQFTEITKRAIGQLISERINERLKIAMASDLGSVSVLPSVTSDEASPAAVAQADSVVTTREELEGFHIIRSILREIVNPERVVMRDSLTYCAVLLDDNNRKTICRLRFNNAQKLSIGVLDQNKEEQRFVLAKLDDIYGYAEQLKSAVKAYLQLADQSTGNPAS
jgi:predicted type IV restriction endonuclease